MPKIYFQPIGRRIEIDTQTDLLLASQYAGVDLSAICGGVGICSGCLIRVIEGKTNPITDTEKDILLDGQVKQGFRLACQTRPLSDLIVEIPESSLVATQKMQITGDEIPIDIDLGIVPIDIKVDAHSISDLRSELSKVNDILELQGLAPLRATLNNFRDLFAKLKNHDRALRLVVISTNIGSQYITSLPSGSDIYGIAVDMGSTKLAFYLIDLVKGATVYQKGIMNPQISYGEDVVSRIAFANQSVEHQEKLQSRLFEVFNDFIQEACQEKKLNNDQIVEIVIVGNTAMHHFLTKLPVEQLGAAPYIPAVSDSLLLNATDFNFDVADGALIYLPENIAGYVGGDHTAALLSSTDYLDQGKVSVLVDIGTNTEISIIKNGKIYSCSTASGPAFEGAHIRDGMRAAPGAIEKVVVEGSILKFSTVEKRLPTGICGTGILNIISELYKLEILDARGVFRKDDGRVAKYDGKQGFLLVPAEKTGHGREIVITRQDVNEIQLAKAAIRTGIEILLHEVELTPDEVTEWIIAGAFGTYLDLESAINIGMFPKVPLSRFRQVGNAAGMGAKQMLLSRAMRRKASDIVSKVEYIELTMYKGFQDIYLDAMYFPKK